MYENGLYSVNYWIMVFYYYSIIGWIWESIYESIIAKKLLNRGFLHGPYIPLYGSGAVVIFMVTSRFRDTWWLLFIAGALVATFLEEVTGRIMDRVFDIRCWTYSGYPGNIDDIICIPATFFWGVLSCLGVYYINRPLEYFLSSMEVRHIEYIILVITIIFVSDATISVKNALAFRFVIERVRIIKEEIVKLRDKLENMVLKNENARESKEYHQLNEKILKSMTEVEIYEGRVRRYIRRILSINPKATVISLGVKVVDLKNDLLSHIPARFTRKERKE
ncbi:MAG: putative ABC transporter permease [Eubacterium sp.]|nr:putative ABC transporter permease [Eubacterium sp.]